MAFSQVFRQEKRSLTKTHHFKTKTDTKAGFMWKRNDTFIHSPLKIKKYKPFHVITDLSRKEIN